MIQGETLFLFVFVQLVKSDFFDNGLYVVDLPVMCRRLLPTVEKAIL